MKGTLAEIYFLKKLKSLPLEIKVIFPCLCFFTHRFTLHHSRYNEDNEMRSIWDYFEKQQTLYNYKVVLSDCGALRGRGRVHAVPWESSSSKCPLNENLESSSFSSSPITQRLEPLNPVPPETNWKLVEHKIDDSQTLGVSQWAWGGLMACVAQTESPLQGFSTRTQK